MEGTPPDAFLLLSGLLALFLFLAGSLLLALGLFIVKRHRDGQRAARKGMEPSAAE